MLDITQTEAETISRQTPNPGDLTNQGETLPIQLIAPDASEELVSSLLEGFEYFKNNELHDSYLEERIREGKGRTGQEEDDEEEMEDQAEIWGCSCSLERSDKDHDTSSEDEGDERMLCLPGSCECVQENGNFYIHREDKEESTICLEAIPNSHVLFECNSNCNCQNIDKVRNSKAKKNRKLEVLDDQEVKVKADESETVTQKNSRLDGRCANRVVGKGIKTPLEVRLTSSRGLGLFTKCFLPKGTFVCEYAGEIIGREEAKNRWELQRVAREGSKDQTDLAESRRKKLEGDNYILTLREYSNDGKCLETSIDPKRKGNIARFINHFCPPLTNLAILPIRCDPPIRTILASPSSTPPIQFLSSPPRASLFTMKDVEAGAELGFDYGSILEESELSKIGERSICFCESEKCRGWLPFESGLS